MFTVLKRLLLFARNSSTPVQSLVGCLRYCNIVFNPDEFLPFSGVTGNALPEDMAKFIACGANKVLTKPLTKAKLFDALAIV